MARLFLFLALIIACSFLVMAEPETHNSHEPELAVNHHTEGSTTAITATDEAHGPVSGKSNDSDSHDDAEPPSNRRLGPNHRSDKSVAGGGVIIGGLVTAIFAAVVCYIRVTRKRNSVL